MCATYVTHVLYLITSNQHTQHRKIYKNQKLKKKWRMTRKIQGSKERKFDLIDRKVWRKMKKMFKKKNLINTQGEINIATVVEELVSSENIAG